jgi:hypothetical protein
VEDLTLEVERQVDNGGKRHVRVTAWHEGARNPCATKSWHHEAFEQEDGEDEAQGEWDAEAARRINGTDSQLQQIVEYNHFLFRQATSAMGLVGDENCKLRLENAALRKHVHAYIQGRQDMLDRSFEREVTARREEALMQGLETLLSVAKFRLMGGDNKAMSQAARSAIASLRASLSEEQLQAVMKVLAPEQQQAIATFFAEDEDEEEQESESEAEETKEGVA